MGHNQRVRQLARASGLRVSGAGLVCWDELEGGEGQAGGTCGNVLANLAYLGAKATLFDRLDLNTSAGQLIRADLEGMGVSLHFASLFPSDSAPVLRRWLGTEKGFKWESKQVELEEMQITGLDKKIMAARVFFFDRANKATLMLARHYAEYGAAIVFEPQRVEGDFEAALAIATIVKYSDSYFPAQGWLAKKAPLEVRSEGKKGLRYRLGGQEGNLRAYKATVVDSAGSGDWLTAGLLAALYEDDFVGLERQDRLEAALKYGQALAAINCEFKGARGMVYELSRAELEDRLATTRAHRRKAA